MFKVRSKKIHKGDHGSGSGIDQSIVGQVYLSSIGPCLVVVNNTEEGFLPETFFGKK